MSYFLRLMCCLFLSSTLFALQAPQKASTSSVITSGEYCEFLNSVATTDPDQLFEELMQKTEDGSWELGPESACILRSGTPGNYSYSVISGKENDPMTGISYLNAAQYCSWKENPSSYSEGSISIFYLPSSIFNMDRCLKSSHVSFSLSDSSATLGTAQSSSDGSWTRDLEIGAGIAAIVAGIATYRTCSARDVAAGEGESGMAVHEGEDTHITISERQGGSSNYDSLSSGNHSPLIRLDENALAALKANLAAPRVPVSQIAAIDNVAATFNRGQRTPSSFNRTSSSSASNVSRQLTPILDREAVVANLPRGDEETEEQPGCLDSIKQRMSSTWQQLTESMEPCLARLRPVTAYLRASLRRAGDYLQQKGEDIFYAQTDANVRSEIKRYTTERNGELPHSMAWNDVLEKYEELLKRNRQVQTSHGLMQEAAFARIYAAENILSLIEQNRAIDKAYYRLDIQHHSEENQDIIDQHYINSATCDAPAQQALYNLSYLQKRFNGQNPPSFEQVNDSFNRALAANEKLMKAPLTDREPYLLSREATCHLSAAAAFQKLDDSFTNRDAKEKKATELSQAAYFFHTAAEAWRAFEASPKSGIKVDKTAFPSLDILEWTQRQQRLALDSNDATARRHAETYNENLNKALQLYGKYVKTTATQTAANLARYFTGFSTGK